MRPAPPSIPVFSDPVAIIASPTAEEAPWGLIQTAQFRESPETPHLFPGEEVFLKIFRKILDLVTFFSQNVSVSGWFQGWNGEAILFSRSSLFWGGPTRELFPPQNRKMPL
jgi:hypothetical protein